MVGFPRVSVLCPCLCHDVFYRVYWGRRWWIYRLSSHKNSSRTVTDFFSRYLFSVYKYKIKTPIFSFPIDYDEMNKKKKYEKMMLKWLLLKMLLINNTKWKHHRRNKRKYKRIILIFAIWFPSLLDKHFATKIHEACLLPFSKVSIFSRDHRLKKTPRAQNQKIWPVWKIENSWRRRTSIGHSRRQKNCFFNAYKVGLPVNELHPNNIKVWNFVPSDMLKHVNSNIGEQDTSYSVDAEKTYRANATVQLIIKKKILKFYLFG